MSIYQPGELVAARYRITKPLSQGGMGAVYLAEQVSLGREVALKVILAQHDGRTDMEDRFDTEARAVCLLKHPNIITYHDYGRDEAGRPYLVMEFLAGYPGTDLLDRQQDLTLIDVVHVVGQLCSALHEAHQKGIIHRDLKWSNAMIVPQSHDPLFTKLIDFGIMKVATDGSSGDQRNELTKTGVLLGTPDYMSPEAICGQAIDGRSDLYALAVMTFELLTGQRPFDGGSHFELLTKHVQEPPPAFRDVGVLWDVPSAVEHAVMTAMAKQPDDRQGSVLEFHQALCDAVGIRGPLGSRRESDAAHPVAGAAGTRPIAQRGGQVTPYGRPSAPQTPYGQSPQTPYGRPNPRTLGAAAVQPATGHHAMPQAHGPAPVITGTPGSLMRPQASAPATRSPWVWALLALGIVSVGFAATLLISSLSKDDRGTGAEVAQVATSPPQTTSAASSADKPAAAVVEEAKAAEKKAAQAKAAEIEAADAALAAQQKAARELAEQAAADRAAAKALADKAAADRLAADELAAKNAAAASALAARLAAEEAARRKAAQAAVVVAPSQPVASHASSATAHRPASQATPPAVRRGKGTLKISVIPFGSVTVNGKPLSGSRFFTTEVRSGTAKIVAKHASYGTRRKSVRVRTNKVSKVVIDFKK